LINGAGRAFEFEEYAHRGFVEVQVKVHAGEAVGGSELLVPETWAEAKRLQGFRPAVGGANREFPFEPLLVPRPRRAPQRNAGRSFRGENTLRAAGGATPGGGGGLETQPEKPARLAEIGSGSVIKSVLLEHTATGDRAHAPKPPDQFRRV